MMTFFIRRRGTVRARHVHEIDGPKRSAPLRPRDLVLAEQVLDATRVLPDHVILPLEHLRDVDADVVGGDAMLGGMLAQELEVL